MQKCTLTPDTSHRFSWAMAAEMESCDDVKLRPSPILGTAVRYAGAMSDGRYQANRGEPVTVVVFQRLCGSPKLACALMSALGSADLML